MLEFSPSLLPMFFGSFPFYSHSFPTFRLRLGHEHQHHDGREHAAPQQSPHGSPHGPGRPRAARACLRAPGSLHIEQGASVVHGEARSRRLKKWLRKITKHLTPKLEHGTAPLRCLDGGSCRSNLCCLKQCHKSVTKKNTRTRKPQDQSCTTP